MTKIRREHLVAIFFFAITINLSSQEENRVNSSWVNVETALEWNKKLEFELSQSNRFNEIIGPFSASNTTLDIAYRITDWLKVIPGYRYGYRQRKQRKLHRFQLGLQARKKIEDLKLTWRTRLEQIEAIGRDRSETRIRNKFSISYNWKALKLEPKIFAESWYSYDPDIDNFSKYRIGVSLAYEIYTRGTINLGFRYDEDLNQPEIEKDYIWVVQYAHKFKRKKATK